jgi:uncharacterized protein (DUF433 family)
LTRVTISPGVPTAATTPNQPQLQPEDIRAALAYAAEIARERIA